MPLTSKGEKILRHMEEEYGSEKKAKEVLYASKNAGKISGIDESSAASMSQAAVSPNPVGGLPATSRQSPVATDKLPTLDQFRRQFRDYARAGLPLQQCLQFGTVWNGKNSDDVKWQQSDSDGFKKAVADAVAAGHSHTKAIRIAVDSWKPRKASKDQVPDQPADPGKISGIGVPMGDSIEMPDNLSKTEKFMKVDVISDKQTVDRRRAFTKGARDALRKGKRMRDAIAAGLDATHTCCENDLFLTSKYCPPDGHVK